MRTGDNGVAGLKPLNAVGEAGISVQDKGIVYLTKFPLPFRSEILKNTTTLYFERLASNTLTGKRSNGQNRPSKRAAVAHF